MLKFHISTFKLLLFTLFYFTTIEGCWIFTLEAGCAEFRATTALVKAFD